MNNRSQAVRLPNALEPSEHVKQVEVIVIGRARLISPIDATWDRWFDSPGVTEDFMRERSHPEAQVREAL